MSGELQGRAVLVTGGGTGIGRACAEKLVADGAAVTICGRTASRLEDAAKIIEAAAAFGGSVQAVVADVTIEESVKAAVEQAGLAGTVRVNKSGCLDQCEHGVTMVVYPEGVWYGFVKLSDVEEIVRSHLIDGEPVERLRLPDTCVNTSRCPHRGGTLQLGLGGL